MKYVCIIAVILAILFGFSVAASFVGIIIIGAIFLLTLSAAFMAATEIIKIHLWEFLKWALVALFFGWLLSVCL